MLLYCEVKEVKMRIIKWLGVIVAGWTGFSAVAVEMPAGYTQLEWVRSTGQQNVNTGWKASKTLRATMDFIPLEQTGNSMLGIWYEFRCSYSRVEG